MQKRDFINEQKDIANARIEVIEGGFIGVIIGLVFFSYSNYMYDILEHEF